MNNKIPDKEQIQRNLNRFIKPLLVIATIGSVAVIIYAILAPMVEIFKITEK